MISGPGDGLVDQPGVEPVGSVTAAWHRRQGQRLGGLAYAQVKEPADGTVVVASDDEHSAVAVESEEVIELHHESPPGSLAQPVSFQFCQFLADPGGDFAGESGPDGVAVALDSMDGLAHRAHVRPVKAERVGVYDRLVAVVEVMQTEPLIQGQMRRAGTQDRGAPAVAVGEAQKGLHRGGVQVLGADRVA